jgi:hypothetical protein
MKNFGGDWVDDWNPYVIVHVWRTIYAKYGNGVSESVTAVLCSPKLAEASIERSSLA